jgi:hypothetical protein
MIGNNSVSSQELNDKLLTIHENLVYLLGYQSDQYPVYSGIYEQLHVSGEAFMVSQSGIPTLNVPNVVDLLKFDYIYRSHYRFIRS